VSADDMVGAVGGGGAGKITASGNWSAELAGPLKLMGLRVKRESSNTAQKAGAKSKPIFSFGLAV